MDAVPPMSAKLQAMNTSDKRTKTTINIIISDLTRTTPDIVSSKVLGSSNTYKTAESKGYDHHRKLCLTRGFRKVPQGK